jgi:hypothetical protein
MTCVLVKKADRWLITAVHNTDIVPFRGTFKRLRWKRL